MLVINKITKTSYITLNKKMNGYDDFFNIKRIKCNYDKSDIPYIIPFKRKKKIIKNEENIINDFVNDLEYLEFNTETYTPYINYNNIIDDFKKLIYNKSS